VTALQSQAAALRAEIEDVQVQLAASSRALQLREAHLAAMEASLSWRLTRPIRMAGTLLLRVRSIFRY
jgi:hypothetical protein